MDFTKFTEDELFGGAGEQLGSQASYQRDLEIRRRLYGLEKVASDAAVLASKATVDSAHWTKVSAIGVLVTVIITGIAVLLQVTT